MNKQEQIKDDIYECLLHNDKIYNIQAISRHTGYGSRTILKYIPDVLKVRRKFITIVTDLINQRNKK